MNGRMRSVHQELWGAALGFPSQLRVTYYRTLELGFEASSLQI